MQETFSGQSHGLQGKVRVFVQLKAARPDPLLLSLCTLSSPPSVAPGVSSSSVPRVHSCSCPFPNTLLQDSSAVGSAGLGCFPCPPPLTPGLYSVLPWCSRRWPLEDCKSLWYWVLSPWFEICSSHCIVCIQSLFHQQMHSCCLINFKIY